MAEIFSNDFPMDETLCRDCAYRMSKVISPVNPEAFGFDPEDLEELDLEDGEELIVEQHTCLINHQDMDYIVKDCSHFKNMTESTPFFINNPYE
jgi:hypothetical protein